MKDTERERFERYKKFVQEVAANSITSEDGIEKYSKNDYLKWVKAIIFFVLILWGFQYMENWVTHSSTSSSDRLWTFYFAIGVAAWLYWKNQFQELRIRMKAMYVMLREIQTTIADRSVSMHEYLAEQAAWKGYVHEGDLDGRDYSPAYMSVETGEGCRLLAQKCHKISMDYEEGRTLPSNERLAEAWSDQSRWWLLRAAERKSSSAQYDVAWMYARGKEVPQNDAEALLWMAKAAESGDVFAQYELGLKHYTGDWTEAYMYDEIDAVPATIPKQEAPKNPAEAFFWFAIVASYDGGGEKRNRKNYEQLKSSAINLRDIAASRLTPGELAHGYERVKNWLESYPSAKAEPQ